MEIVVCYNIRLKQAGCTIYIINNRK